MNRTSRWLLMILIIGAVPGARADVTVDADYPGGNIVFERIEGDDVYLHQDIRDTTSWWFYWNYRVRGAAGRSLTFHFTNKDVIDLQGPAVSLDEGASWSWLGTETVSGASFSYTFGPDADSVRFCYAVPYQEADLLDFLAAYTNHPHLKVETLCQDRSGRSVERLHLGKLDGEPRYRVALTCRHHACEMMASWVLEGILAAILADTEDGRWFRENVEVLAVPFMDKDGVEDGDQGKLRAPHDHARDYTGEAIYPTVRALKAFLPAWSEGKLRIAIDMHDPYIHDNRIYWVLNPDEPCLSNTRTFLSLLDDAQEGPLTYSSANDTVWPASWEGWDKTPMAWFRTLPGVTVSTALEMPYSTNAGMQVTPDGSRAFGRDIARAIRVYLTSIAPPPFRETFEAEEEMSGTLGPLDGQNGWTAVDAVVQNTDVRSGAQACSLTSRTARISQTFAAGETNVWTELWLKPVFTTNHTAMMNPPAGSSFAFYVYTNGLVTAFDGTNRAQLAHEALAKDEWGRFAVHSDYSAKRWDLYLNGDRIADDLRFYDANAMACTEFGVRGGADDGPAVLDDIQLWLPAPLIGTVMYGR